MPKGIDLEVWGPYALFSRPEFKVERMSYDIMTPSAARGILEAIYFHPGMVWVIDKIKVLSPIRFTNVRRNEVKSKLQARSARTVMSGSNQLVYINTSEDIQQRASTLLRDVHYIISAHFELTDQATPMDNKNKFYAIAMNRIKKGQCFQQPYMGCREFPAYYQPADPGVTYNIPDELAGEHDFSYMFYDFNYSDPMHIEPQFFRAILKDGVLDLSECEVIR